MCTRCRLHECTSTTTRWTRTRGPCPWPPKRCNTCQHHTFTKAALSQDFKPANEKSGPFQKWPQRGHSFGNLATTLGPTSSKCVALQTFIHMHWRTISAVYGTSAFTLAVFLIECPPFPHLLATSILCGKSLKGHNFLISYPNRVVISPT